MWRYECVFIGRNDVTQQQADSIVDGIVSQLETHHIRGMAKYAISSGTGRGFDVKIVGDDGVRQTMLGFPTRQAAEAWIVEDQLWSQEEVQSSLRPQ